MNDTASAAAAVRAGRFDAARGVDLGCSAKPGAFASNSRMWKLGVVVLMVALAGAARAVDTWDIQQNYAAFALADAHWTIDESFPGRKLLLEGNYTFNSRPGKVPQTDCACDAEVTPQRLVGTINAHLQWGDGESQLEYGVLTFSSFGWEWEHPLDDGEFDVVRDTVEWGVLRVVEDDPLGIESYVELTVARGARIWGYHSPGSRWSYTVGVSISGGFAWAEAADERYQDVSNLTAGTWVRGTVARAGWGSIYLEQRVVNGWGLSSPARSGSISREARARLAYQRDLPRSLSFEFFAEKRSFNFADPDLQNLYAASKRIGVQIAKIF